MISYAFVNGGSEELLASSPLLSLQELLIESEISIHETISEFMDKMTEYVEESTINGEEDEEKRLMLEAEGNNVFTKIGEKVIELGKKVVEFLKNCIDKITNLSFKSKKDIDKVELLCKEYPNLRDEIVCSFQKGELDVSSARSLRELENTYEEIVKLSKKADVTPGSLQDKWNKAVKKFENAEKTPVFTIAATTASAMSLYIAIRSFKGNCMKIKNDVNDQKNRAAKYNGQLADIIETMKNTSYSKDGEKLINDDMGKMEVLFRANKYLSGEYSAAAGKSVKVMDKLSNSIVRFVSKKTSDEKKKQFHKDMKLAKVINDKNKS